MMRVIVAGDNSSSAKFKFSLVDLESIPERNIVPAGSIINDKGRLYRVMWMYYTSSFVIPVVEELESEYYMPLADVYE